MNNKAASGISPLIASVILIAFTIAIAIIVTGAMTSISKTQTEQATKSQKCPANILDIIQTSCTNAAGAGKGNITIRATILNNGRVDLTSFTLTAIVNGAIYTNSSPVYGSLTLKPGNITTLEAATTNTSLGTTGQISKLRISAGGDCPGLYIEKKNDTVSIGDCA